MRNSVPAMLRRSIALNALRLQSATFVENPVNRVATVSLQLARTDPAEPYGFQFRKPLKRKGGSLKLRHVPLFLVDGSPILASLFPDKGRIYAGSAVFLTSVNGISASDHALAVRALQVGQHHSVSLAVQMGARRTTRKTKEVITADEVDEDLDESAEAAEVFDEADEAVEGADADEEAEAETEVWFRRSAPRRQTVRGNAATKKRAALSAVDEAVAAVMAGREIDGDSAFPSPSKRPRGRPRLRQPARDAADYDDAIEVDADGFGGDIAGHSVTSRREVAQLKQMLAKSLAAVEELRDAKRRRKPAAKRRPPPKKPAKPKRKTAAKTRKPQPKKRKPAKPKPRKQQRRSAERTKKLVDVVEL